MSYINILELMYPVGSIYMSVNSTPPRRNVGADKGRVPISGGK